MLNLNKDRLRRLRWGIIGCGRFTETAILPGLGLIARARVRAIYSHDLSRAKALADKFGIPLAFNNLAELLASDVEAVYIGSANAHHYGQVLAAARAGKHILCDKPLAVTSAQAEEMVRVCKENNVHLAVNYVYRFHPLVEKARELVANQTIGALVSVTANFNINLVPDANFRFSRQLAGGGPIRDLASHMIDLFRYIGGELTPVHGVLDNIVYKTEVEDFAAGTLKYEKSGYAFFNVSYSTRRAFNRIEIVGSTGSMALENLVSQRFASSRLTIILDGEARKAFRKRAVKLHRLLKSVNRSFLKNETPEVTGEDGLISLRLIEGIEGK